MVGAGIFQTSSTMKAFFETLHDINLFALKAVEGREKKPNIGSKDYCIITGLEITNNAIANQDRSTGERLVNLCTGPKSMIY